MRRAVPDPLLGAFGPGRVNVIGEHADYNGGLALPFAIERGVTVTVTPTGGREVTTTAHGARRFLRGTVMELRDLGMLVPGARVDVRSTLPVGAGLSSSAALGAALALALIALAGEPEPPDRRDLARLCSRVENDWVGANTGLLDQVAVLMSPPGGALLIDFSDLSTRAIPLDLSDWMLAVLDSGERHAHAVSGYNERRAECEAGDPRRLRHVRSENERVRAAVAALEAHDLPSLATLLNASHVSLRDDFEVSTPAVETTRKRLLEAGAQGARIIGGGFGGSVLGLFPPGTSPPPEASTVVPGSPAHLLDQAS